jgi:hypothetical protein
MKTTRHTHCLIRTAAQNGINLEPARQLLRLLPLLLLAAVLLLLAVCLHLIAAVLVERKPRRKDQETTTAGNETNVPSVEPIVEALPLVPSVVPLPVVMVTPTMEAIQPEVDEPVGPCFEEPESCTPQALACLNARYDQADAVARKSDRKARKSRRKPATIAARAVTTPEAVCLPEDEVVTMPVPATVADERWTPTDRILAEGKAANAEGEAFLARRAVEKEAEAQVLAGKTVVELRRLAARCGHRGTRTLRRAQLLELLA